MRGRAPASEALRSVRTYARVGFQDEISLLRRPGTGHTLESRNVFNYEVAIWNAFSQDMGSNQVGVCQLQSCGVTLRTERHDDLVVEGKAQSLPLERRNRSCHRTVEAQPCLETYSPEGSSLLFAPLGEEGGWVSLPRGIGGLFGMPVYGLRLCRRVHGAQGIVMPKAGCDRFCAVRTKRVILHEALTACHCARCVRTLRSSCFPAAC